jgi:hypothetical protein
MGTITAVLMTSTVILMTIGLLMGIRWVVTRWKTVRAAERAGLPTPLAVDLVKVTEGVVSRETKVYPAGPAPLLVFGAFRDVAQVPAVIPGLADLQRNDPDFQATDFLSRAVAVVASVREAQRTGHPDQASGVMSDRLYQRWKAGATISAPDPSFAQRGLWVAEVRAGQAGDAIAVRMQENVLPGTIRTVWVFVRSLKTRATPSSTGAICPNCGAPVAREMGTCPFCHAAMFRNSTEWVLDDIVLTDKWTGLSTSETGDRPGSIPSPKVQASGSLEIRPRWPYGYFGKVITATGEQFVCRRWLHRTLTITFQSVAEIVLCGIEEGDLIHPSIFFFDAKGRCLLWVYADQYRVSDFDELFQRVGVVPAGTWKDYVPINKITSRFPGAFDQKVA